jgi:cell division protein FtsW (lipid II flippase)
MRLTRIMPTRLPLVLGFTLALCLGLATWLLFPKPGDSRELALATATASWVRPAAPTTFSAEAFCTLWTGQPLDKVDCRSGYDMSSLLPQTSEQAPAAWAQALEFVGQRQSLLQSLLNHLNTFRADQPRLTPAVLALQSRLDAWSERAQQLSLRNERTPPVLADYSDMFLLLLEQQGQHYEASTGRFKTIQWHMVRSADQPSTLHARSTWLAVHLAWLPFAVFFSTALLLGLGWWRARWLGWGLTAGYMVLSWLSLLVVADASVHFGEGSSVFHLNPLGNQLNRQMGVGLISLLIISVGLCLAPWCRRAIHLATQHVGLTMLGLIMLTGFAYAAHGPALGSEALKLGTSVMAGLMTAAFGRSVHITANIAPVALKPWTLLSALRPLPTKVLDPVHVVSAQLSQPLLQFTAFCAVGVGAAALVFNDLGAALVTAILALTALYIVFGSRIANLMLLLGVMMAAIMSQTDKVQGRIALMLDPLTASVSDFARLLAFSNAAYDSGFSLGKIEWCSGAGVCIPLQALSDYMPVVLTGVLGARGTYLFFALYLLAMVGLMAWLVRQFLTHQGHTRALAMMAFFMIWGTAMQTAVTFLGNWRIVPLTGLGAPLLSIGLSSALVPVIALTLTLLVRHTTQEGAP